MHGRVVVQYLNISALMELIMIPYIENPHEGLTIPAVIYSLGRMNKDRLEELFYWNVNLKVA